LTKTWNYAKLLVKIILPVLLLLPGRQLLFPSFCSGNSAPKNQKTMESNILDQPEILQVLFHPRKSDRTALPAGARDIDIAISDDTTIGCRLFTHDKSAPTLLFFHGNGEIAADYDTIGPEYRQVGLNFLVTDYRGYGWSSGTPTATNLLADARNLYLQLLQDLHEHGYTGPVFVMGRSLGSACAIDVAAQHNDEIGGLIIDSGFAETLPLARILGLDPDRLGITEEMGFGNKEKISRVTKPTLILHGAEDQLIPLAQAEKLMAAGGARAKELQVIPGADHNSLILVGGALYFQAIRRFIDKATGADDWRQRRRAWKKINSNHQER